MFKEENVSWKVVGSNSSTSKVFFLVKYLFQSDHHRTMPSKKFLITSISQNQWLSMNVGLSYIRVGFTNQKISKILIYDML